MTTSTALTYEGKPAALPPPLLIGRPSDGWPPADATHFANTVGAAPL